MTLQGCSQFRRFEERIGKKEISKNIVLLDQRFCRTVERFAFFETSILEYLNIILSNKYYIALFNLIGISNPNFAISVMNAIKKKHFSSVYLRKMKDVIKYHEIYSIFSDSSFLIDPERIVDWKIRPFDTTFVLNENQIAECPFSWKCSNNTIEKGFSVFREVLKLSGGSDCESVSTLYWKKSNQCIEIDDSVEIIELNIFRGSDSFTEIVFSSDSH
jgi:hypothetical protein